MDKDKKNSGGDKFKGRMPGEKRLKASPKKEVYKKEYTPERERPVEKISGKGKFRKKGEVTDFAPERTERDRPAYTERKGGDFDRKPRGYKPEYSSKNSHARDDKKPFKSDRDKPAYGNRKDGKGGDFEMKPRKDKADFGDKKPFRSDRDKPAYGDRKVSKSGDFDRKPRKDKADFGDKKPFMSYRDKPAYGDRSERKIGDSDRKPRKDKPEFERGRKLFSKDEKKPFAYKDRSFSKNKDSREKSFGKKEDGARKFGKSTGPGTYKSKFDKEKTGTYKPFEKREGSTDRAKTYKGKDREAPKYKARERGPDRTDGYKGKYKDKLKVGKSLEKGKSLIENEVRLNRYIANSGLCSRREADVLIEQGKVDINGQIITELGSKVIPGDIVQVNGKKIMPEKAVYILLNKPKGYITTTDDPDGRNTVMDLIDLPDKERIYPVGRLDRNTTGVLLLTNDGELAQKITHPSFSIKKVYRATLDRKPTKEHMLAWVNGVELEDGPMSFEQVGFVSEDDDKVLGLEISSGRNRIVRRMFEHFGYQIDGLERVLLGDFDKVKLGRGKWRFLNDKEIEYVERLKRTKPKKI